MISARLSFTWKVQGSHVYSSHILAAALDVEIPLRKLKGEPVPSKLLTMFAPEWGDNL